MQRYQEILLNTSHELSHLSLIKVSFNAMVLIMTRKEL
jgi:hypothetical protein